MDIVADPTSLRQTLQDYRAAGETVAFVPTMGNLHAGHLSLVNRAASLADRVVVSIFVNPMQFGPNEDLDAYPRTLEADLAQLKAAGVALVFTPQPEHIYPEGIDAHTKVSVPGLTNVLCGASRPGHFDGVTSVVCKLFSLVAPNVAVFGEKDLQQLLIIKKMVHDLALPVAIEGVATARDDDGLALSSRNGYLTAEERAIAPGLRQTLIAMGAAISTGERHYDALCQAHNAHLENQGFKPDYLEIRCRSTLALATSDTQQLAIFVAAKLGKTRLIDNLQLDL